MATATGTVTATRPASSDIDDDSDREPQLAQPGAIAGVVSLVVQDLVHLLGI
jgi:hypothetical protein